MSESAPPLVPELVLPQITTSSVAETPINLVTPHSPLPSSRRSDKEVQQVVRPSRRNDHGSSTTTTTTTLFATVLPDDVEETAEQKYGSAFVGLETVLGVTSRSNGGTALCYNQRHECLLYAAGSTLVLWNFRRDTRMYLEGDGHATTVGAVATTDDGRHVASAR